MTHEDAMEHDPRVRIEHYFDPEATLPDHAEAKELIHLLSRLSKHMEDRDLDDDEKAWWRKASGVLDMLETRIPETMKTETTDTQIERSRSALQGIL